jgi:hypothetical protein
LRFFMLRPFSRVMLTKVRHWTSVVGMWFTFDWEPRTVAASVRRRLLVACLLGREVRCGAV